MAFTAVAAIVGGAEITAAVVLAAVTEVGLALTVVGAVTGNEDLMKIGGIMGLVGGIGGMITGALGGAATAGLGEAATTSALDAASAEAIAGTTYTSAGAELAANAADQAALAGLEGGAGSAGGIVGGLDAPAAAADPSAMVPGAEAAPGAPAPTVNDVAGAQAPQDLQMPVGPQEVTNPYSNPTDMRLANGTQTTPGVAPENAGGLFGRFSSLVEKNKTLFSGGMQLLGGAMKGASDADMWNQKMDLERQRLGQTSYGSATGRYQGGIVGGAR